VAVMPSVGRIKQLSVLGVAAAVLGVAAPKASAANDVWFWACQSPTGTALPFSGTNSFTGNVTAETPACATTGITAALGASATSGTESSAQFYVPSSGLSLTGVSVTRATHGFGAPVAGDNKTYAISTTKGGPLETLNDSTAAGDLTGTFTKDTAAPGPINSGDGVKVGVFCATGPCVNNAVSVDITRVGLKVAEPDNAAPTVAVGGTRDPAGGVIGQNLKDPDNPKVDLIDPETSRAIPSTQLKLDVRAADNGTGLKSATVSWADVPADLGPVDTALYNSDTTPDHKKVGDPSCKELDDSNAPVVDLPLGVNCSHADAINLRTDTAKIPNGPHTLVVKVSDWAGNVTTRSFPLTVNNNPDLGVSSQTLNIGTSGVNNQAANNNAANNGNGGVAGASSQNCNTPRLSVVLSDKPVKVSRGVPILRANKRYKFSGRLTCVINGKRKSAPKRARIDLLNKVGKKTSDKSGTTVADKGNFSIILAYSSSRTLIFRFTNTDNKRSQVSIKIKVEKAKKKKK
jgi:hypothetical protein